MTEFLDLTPYAYDTMKWETPLLNVGWLGATVPFNRGVAPSAFVLALAELCRHPQWLHRGLHICELCPVATAVGAKFDGNALEYGNGQLRVLGRDGTWYSAPTLVHHYVVAHGYLPPNEFVDAVTSGLAVGVDSEGNPHFVMHRIRARRIASGRP